MAGRNGGNLRPAVDADLKTWIVFGKRQHEELSSLPSINRRFDRGTAGLGASGWQNSPAWASRQELLSERFTTSLADLPRATC
ncbi:DUF4113 domain-containing protein [Xanthomonas vesicatoria]|uniref:DUF4113 domain-containing protein n=1 Tax=Xanthomonas vesicatoria TaxID=56460 RepID=UPI001E3C9BC1|nr:DUF4113 domain-containing protein [Xanthomonas vesicatoria]MCC8619446.1 DUF4113 domain-containing protein [Xanthomonas vesicatoria]MCC8633096.1 DUF4113 domain-containing protein [Xanthomonas vesicatoria]